MDDENNDSKICHSFPPDNIIKIVHRFSPTLILQQQYDCDNSFIERVKVYEVGGAVLKISDMSSVVKAN